MPTKKYLLVDAKNLMWRAESAMGDLTTKAGVPTGAIHGFLTMLLRVHAEYGGAGTDTIICWDDWEKGPQARRDLYKSYKVRPKEATDARKESADRVAQQQKGLRTLFKHLGVTQARSPGWEADDVMGTLARRYGAHTPVLILTGDRDLFQCITDNVRVLRPRQAGNIEVMTKEKVHEEFGVLPSQFIDYKAIVGDPGDGYPGCPGIGEKGAAELIQKWGSLDEILGHLDYKIAASSDAFKPAHFKKLTANVDLVRTCQKLATINTHAPLKVSAKDVSRTKVLKLLHKWEMKQMLTQYNRLSALEGPGDDH